MKKIFAGLALFVVAAAAILHITGCETESVGDQQITITPNSTGLLNGQFADFTASGGYEYTWSLDTPSWGLLSDTHGSTVRYTSRYEPGTTSTDSNGVTTSSGSAMQVIRVTSRIPGSSTGGTSSSPTGETNTSGGYVASGSAQVEHLPTPVEPDPDAELYISPSSTSMTPNTAKEFAATGGDGTYYWALSNPEYGKLNITTGSKIVYTATFNPGGDNTVIQSLMVTSGDLQFSATILQSGTETEIVINPSSATMAPSSKMTFSATGGNGTYSWTLNSSSYGTLNSSSGSAVEYTAWSSTNHVTQVLYVTSGTKQKSANITQQP